MALNVAKNLAELRQMTPAQLRERYLDVFGEPSRSGHKEWLIKRIIWRLQANAEGGLSERAKRRALELANDADIRLRAPTQFQREAGLVQSSVTRKLPARNGNGVPPVGTPLVREYKGRTLEVLVRDNGFEFEGERYRTLSALAKKITGTHTSGNLFFRLGKYAEAR